MKHFIYLSLVMVFVFIHLGHTASISKVNAKALRSIAGSLEEPVGAGGDMAIPEKRYSNQYYTNMRSKQYDRAAMRNILKTMFVGKRSETVGMFAYLNKTCRAQNAETELMFSKPFENYAVFIFSATRMQASKRSPADALDDASDIASIGYQPSDDVNAYVIFPKGLDDSVITAFLQQLDSPRERLTTERK